MSHSVQPRLSVLRVPRVTERTGLARSSIYLLVQRGQFPKPIHLSSNTVGWLEHEVEAWIAKRAKSSRVASYNRGQ